MKLGKILGTLLVLLAMFVFVGCGDEEQWETPVDIDWGTDFYVEGNGYDWQESGPYTVYEGDSFRVQFHAIGSYDRNTKFELHEKTLGVVDSDIDGWVDYEVDTNFTDLNAGETKEYEFWATAAGFTSEKVKVILKDREPLILTDVYGTDFLGFPGEVKINEYVYDFNLISHDKNTVKFTKDTNIKQFTRLKGEETFVEKTITGIYPSKGSGGSSYANGNVTVSFKIPKENVNKDIELYYEYEGLKSNVITVKTLNYYFDIKVTDVCNHEISDENPLVVYADATTSLKFDISLFGPDGEIEDFEYTFTDMFGDSEIKNDSGFIYELPNLNEVKDFYNNNMWQWNDDWDYKECGLCPYFKYTIEVEECSGEIIYYIDCGDCFSGGNWGEKDAPVYYWDIPSAESAKTLFIGDDGVWQKTDFSTTLTLKSDGSLNYGTFKNDCLDDKYDFEGTYIINPLKYTAKATVELDGEEKTFEISLTGGYDSDKERWGYSPVFTMDLSSLGLNDDEVFVKKLTTTPKINGYYYIYSENFGFTFMIDENSKSYYFRQRYYDDYGSTKMVERIGTFSTEGNIISFEPLGDPNFEGKKGIISNDGLLSIQFYDYENERDDVALLYKDKDISLELWLGNEESLFVFDRKAKTLLMNGISATYVDTETGFKMKADNFYDENGNPVEYEGLTVEDDVFRFDFTDEGGPEYYFVKVNFEEFDFDGTWVCDEGSVTIDSSKETGKVSFTVGDWSLSSLERPYDHFGNFFCANGQNGWMCSGAVSKSGKLYCAYRGKNYGSENDYVHSNLVLTKQ